MIRSMQSSKPQPSELNNQLHTLEKKERKSYEALAALVRFIKGIKKQEWLKITDFCEFKKKVLASVADFGFKKKAKTTHPEPKFNVKHYERAILSASDPAYRDMAIQAASKDLTHEALGELITSLCRDCQRVSRQVKELATELRKGQVGNGVRQLWQNVVEPGADKDSEAAPASVG